MLFNFVHCLQAPPVERYLHDLLQYALGVLHIVTLVPHSRKLIVNATLSNNRVGIAVILDAANGASFVDPEVRILIIIIIILNFSLLAAGRLLLLNQSSAVVYCLLVFFNLLICRLFSLH